VAVEKLFFDLFRAENCLQVVEPSFSADAEIRQNYYSGSFFNSHSPLHQ
jgi:hypothetical protein